MGNILSPVHKSRATFCGLRFHVSMICGVWRLNKGGNDIIIIFIIILIILNFLSVVLILTTKQFYPILCHRFYLRKLSAMFPAVSPSGRAVQIAGFFLQLAFWDRWFECSQTHGSLSLSLSLSLLLSLCVVRGYCVWPITHPEELYQV